MARGGKNRILIRAVAQTIILLDGCGIIESVGEFIHKGTVHGKARKYREKVAVIKSPHPPDFSARIAQKVEHPICNRNVGGSIPSSGSNLWTRCDVRNAKVQRRAIRTIARTDSFALVAGSRGKLALRCCKSFWSAKGKSNAEFESRTRVDRILGSPR
jgi:hypothetical protein